MLDSVKQGAAFHLKTARGQIEGILKMMEDDRYCIDVSKQILSAQSLLKKANMEILRGHIKTCVKDAMNDGQGDEKIEEIFEIIEKYAKPGG
jgi:DNA-binding FrmR family transcriptional regulator